MVCRRRSAFRRVQVILLATAVAVPWTLVTPQPADAAPSYKHPLYCGRDFKGHSYPGHSWGLDILSTTFGLIKDQEVMASANGTVSEVLAANGQVRVNHTGGFYTVYAHMNPIVVTQGQGVVAGQLLGFASNKSSLGPVAYHLHYGQDLGPYPWNPQQVRFNGTAYNYVKDVDVYGSNIDSSHCPTPPATDIWVISEVSLDRRTAIGWLYTEQITTGCGLWFDNPAKRARYCPMDIVTRGQMATFLDKYLDLPDTSNNYFTDIAGSIHEQAINNIRAAQITVGCTATTFCPGGDVTRGQMATFLSKALDLPAASIDYFTDDNSNLHEPRINNIRKAEITLGCTPPYLYCPNGLVSRGQMATFLHNGRDLRP